MATVDDSLRIQDQEGILTAPATSSGTSASTEPASHGANVPTASSGTPSTVTIALQNNTTSSVLYAYVTGLDTNNNGAVWMLQSDGSTSYYPANPSSDGTALAVDVGIIVGSPGSVRTVTVPHLAGARVWFSQDAPLTFKLNVGVNGPALVEPSVTNTSDPNYQLRWDFCEFTFNSTEMFANISYVDFVSIPVALELTTTDGSGTQTVAGLPSDGLDTVCKALQKQQTVDCAGWDQLVVQIATSAGTSFLRALSPYNAMIINGKLFPNYFDAVVSQAWSQYASSALTIETQTAWGMMTGQVDASTNKLIFSDIGAFPKPTTSDIFSCSTGAFTEYTNNRDEMGNLGARLSAALNRGTLLLTANQPDGASSSDYYQTAVCNHYSRILHATNLDGRGYAFPYDDVAPTNGADQSGAVSSGAPAQLTVYIGGGGSSGTAAVTTRRGATVPIFEHNNLNRGLVIASDSKDSFRRVKRSLPPPPAEEKEEEAHAPSAKPVFLLAIDEKQLLKAQERAASDPEKMDLEMGVKSDKPAPSSPADLKQRFALLLHQALLYLWAAICALARSAWALVPRRVAAPTAAFFGRVGALPAVTAAAASVSALASSAANSVAASAVAAMLVRPLVTRALMTAVVLLVTYVATSGAVSPMVASAASSAAGWLHGLTDAEPLQLN